MLKMNPTHKNRIPIIFSSFLVYFYLFTGCGGDVRQNTLESATNWPVYLGDNSSSQYSPLDLINTKNVHLLEPVWKYKTENLKKDDRTQIQCNPLIIDGILYGTSPKLRVFALNAATGKRIWEFNPSQEINFAMNVNRGVTWWSDGTDKKIFFTAGAVLYALNAETGKLVSSFGQQGKVSLKEGLGENATDKYVVATSPGIVYKDLIILGSRVSENTDAAPGHIRAYHVKTGKLEWVFHTIPQPGEFGYETWPEGAWKEAGGANSWAGMSLDEERGMVFIPTGSAAFDFWGGNRKGQNLFANCVLALDAATGKRIWHFQTVYHDIWDRDLPAPPNLVTVSHNGEKIDAVAQITKSGFVFLLHRETGEPLFPVEDRPVPSSDLKGEETWPVQPFPLKPPPFSPQSLTMENITDISAESREYVAQILNKSRTGEPFIPPSMEGTVIFPGFDGGGEWGGAAWDQETSVLYVNSNTMPWILTMVEIEEKTEKYAHRGEPLYQLYCAMCHGQNMEGNPGANYPSLINLEENLTKAGALEIMNSGKGFMPSYRHLKPEETDLLISYIYNETDEDAHTAGIEKNAGKVPYRHTGYNRFLDPEGYPAAKPPWGTLSAINLNEGEILWQVPLGEFAELTARGIPKTGTENYGGPVVTAGGLIFIAASKDEYFRAFDKNTGEELWKYKLPAGGYATPAVYEVNGQQYVVIACGGGKMGTPPGNSYVAFALKNTNDVME
jgi:quinoprotein glucose dehydrogenase